MTNNSVLKTRTTRPPIIRVGSYVPYNNRVWLVAAAHEHDVHLRRLDVNGYIYHKHVFIDELPAQVRTAKCVVQ